MIGYAIMAALIVGASGGWLGGQWWVQSSWDADKARRADAEAMVVALSDKSIDDLEKAETEKKAMYAKGKADGIAMERKVSGRVSGELTRFPVFQNPVCKLPPQSFALYVATINGVRTGVVLPPEDAPTASAPVTPPPVPSVRPPKPIPRKKAAP